MTCRIDIIRGRRRVINEACHSWAARAIIENTPKHRRKRQKSIQGSVICHKDTEQYTRYGGPDKNALQHLMISDNFRTEKVRYASRKPSVWAIYRYVHAASEPQSADSALEP